MSALDQFSADLSRLADLTDDELSTLESNLMSAFDAADQANNEQDMNDLADALDQVRSEQDKRGDSSPDGNDTPQADNSSPDTSAPAAAPVDNSAPPAATAASANPNSNNTQEEDPAVSTSIPKGRAPQPVEAAASHITITAGGDIPGYSMGTEFKDMADFSEAFAKRISTLNRLSGGDGERVVVASMVSEAPEDRILHLNDPVGNRDKIEAVINPAAITASGGFCAPLSTRYDLFTIGETDRPVRDSLVGFQSDRGGVRFFTPPTLAAISNATGFWDTAADAAYDPANETTWKPVGTVACPAEQEAYTEAVTMALKFGVVSSRVFPENVAAHTQLALVQHARQAESALLAKIKNQSTPITGPATVYGAVRDLLLTVARTAAWYRDRHRLNADVTLRAILPLWIVDVMRADILIQPPAGSGRTTDFSISRTDIENFFDQWNVNITWALDGVNPASNLGGNYADLADTASTTDPAGTKDVPAFPTSMEWALYAEGTWLFLDGGTLDLGIIRDSKLARGNDYLQFSESFEGAAKIGPTSLWITSPVTVLGAYSKSIA